ncbi:hypothetical protein C8A00DRAFT_34948 [Chaetomidium leptoderma]|uniref:Uncharacterized protein n=1 Tax=Chaetomidium leptoderma TaxID=669021 RepID=A0AAN6ZXE3_9PEZI|nr:hypothetical protein C8A00DRAFT_34948 [Chaetomidium leptoderma]
MATEPASSLSPNRPIRPLPKRRLRERLSPDVADSIQYPPLPRSSTALFSYPYSLVEEQPDAGRAPGRELGSHPEQRQAQSNGARNEREGNGTALRQGAGRRATPQHANLTARPKPEHGRYADSLPLLSTASSADGYDPFENTNNKKRKIPTAGDSAPSGAHGINDSAPGTGSLAAGGQSAESQDEPLAATSTPYYGSGSFASNVHNVPGPGRGRYGRPRSGKNTLRPLYDSTNSWAGRTTRPRPGQWISGTSESTGIISNAIAKAEKLAPHHGQENLSLLHQLSSTKRSPASTQFTFTCDSQVPGSLAWPGIERRIAMPQYQGGAVGQGKENWPRASQSTQTGHPTPAMPQAADVGAKEAPSRGGVGGQNQHAVPAPKSSRRSATKEYLAAAKARRGKTQLRNKRHPPKPEDMWVCHFCEYEWIFGHPPEALVRAYEIKERKQKQLEEQRRAQWERMKKGKHKGKKNSKLPAKNSNAAQDAHHHADSRGAPGDHYDHGAQGEEYYDDEYYEDEEYDAEEEVALEGGPEIPGRHDHVPAHFGGSSAVHDGGGT